MTPASRTCISFGSFRLYPDERRLERGDEVAEIGGRAFDILSLLVHRPGEVVSQKEFQEKVWPGSVVGDVNLRVQITALRKLLSEDPAGSHGIRSITGRGYCFVGPVTYAALNNTTVAEALDDASNDISNLIGRRAAIEDICRLLSTKRFVSIVGPGGIGKSAAALVAVRAFSEANNVTTSVIELSSVSHGDHVASTVASTLELLVDNRSPTDAITDYLAKSERLLLLDCCEHVIDAVAQLALAISQSCEHVTILATSREPLRVPDEYVYRIKPLDVPEHAAGISTAEALSYSGVRLFCERSTSFQSNEFAVLTDNIATICNICASLDGLPLAIELAAAQVHVFGAEGLLDVLDKRLDVLTRGHRTALPRHRTLRSTIDWSYDTLTEHERKILRYAAIFKGSFSFAQVGALLNDSSPLSPAIVSSMANLVDKSLLASIPGSQPPTFRLLDSTRAYGLEKLGECGEYEAVARRHAQYFLSLFTEPAVWSSTEPALDELAGAPRILNDVRAALDWALASATDKTLGVALTWASGSLFYQLYLCEEYRQRVMNALQFIQRGSEADAESEFRLLLALAQADFLTQSLKRGISTHAFREALALTTHHHHEVRQVHVLYGTIVMTTMAGEYDEANRFCGRLYELSRARTTDVPMYHRMQALVDTQSGRVEGALHHADVALSIYGPRIATRKVQDPTRYDARIALTSLRSRILWLVGLVDDAATVAAESVEEALSLGHDLSVCCSLASGACPVACWRGDHADLEKYLSLLEGLSSEYLLVNWRDQAECYGFGRQQAMRPQGKAWWRAFDHWAPTAHETLATVNRQLLTPLAIERATSGKAGWATPEIWRVLGEQYLEHSSKPLEKAETLFRDAISLSMQHGTFSFELRAATSLSRFLFQKGERQEAEDVLSTTLSRVSQGAETRDVRTARAVLDEGLELGSH
ncbi:winged helix-turn-helix domain-containing protein [Burkholderia sp. Bp8998]|uniref:ATP-binding protein n=1 Tax=Burkholderia sp. Bp8998 TaxID=2184557 RepID=UPI000F59F5D0|nr:winged helix-turn-helix domain-containing protein [Burkholderia sp. Bp8998]RQS24242.1 hypothetical protein DIE06_00145 [Burkholderia sp. Bp8998]